MFIFSRVAKPFFFDISDYFCVKCVFVAKNCHLCEIKKLKQKSKLKYVGVFFLTNNYLQNECSDAFGFRVKFHILTTKLKKKSNATHTKAMFGKNGTYSH